MPLVCTVTGSFVRNGHPIRGVVRFTPERLWVVENKITWATLAPVTELDPWGRFEVLLTPTDTDAVPWYYLVESPAGKFRIRIYQACREYTLKELIDEHHPRPRPANG